MNTDRIKNNVVLICDRVSSREGISILSDNLEFTSDAYFNAIKTALEKKAPKVYHYEEPSEFLENINLHKNDIVISAIWSGTKSRNRKALIASICEAYNIKYLGADAYVQSVCQDKQLSKHFLDDSILEAPKGVLFDSSLENYDKLCFLNFPIIIKPNLEATTYCINYSGSIFSNELWA